MTEGFDVQPVLKGYYKITLIVKAENELEAVHEARNELAREVLRHESHSNGFIDR